MKTNTARLRNTGLCLAAAVAAGVLAGYADGAGVATVPQTPKPSEPIAAIAAYAGAWQAESERLKTPFSAASRESKTIVNDCWRSGEFYSCHQYVDGKSAALVVYRYIAKEDRFTLHTILPDGSGIRGHLIIRGNVWTFPWQESDKGETTFFRVTNTFATPDTIDYREEYSHDGRHWLPIAMGRDRRLQPPS